MRMGIDQSESDQKKTVTRDYLQTLKDHTEETVEWLKKRLDQVKL